jgi:hypothetical protein
MKYFFNDYYKYSFTVKDEQGDIYRMDSEYCNSGDIYRFDISGEGEFVEKNGKLFIDGIEFIKEV